MSKILLIIDLQKEFADRDGGKQYQKCLDFIQDKQTEYTSVIATYFHQDGTNDNYKKHLAWNGCQEVTTSSLEFLDNISHPNISVIAKTGYGLSLADMQQLSKTLTVDDEIDIIGCDADACVLAICFQLWDIGCKNIRILMDYIYTNANSEKYGITMATCINIMQRNFGDCVIMPK